MYTPRPRTQYVHDDVVVVQQTSTHPHGRRSMEESVAHYTPPRPRAFPRDIPTTTGSMAILPLIMKQEERLTVNKNLLRVDWIEDWSHIVVAGGHVLNAVIDDPVSSAKGDVDIFIIDDDDDAVVADAPREPNDDERLVKLMADMEFDDVSDSALNAQPRPTGVARDSSSARESRSKRHPSPQRVAEIVRNVYRWLTEYYGVAPTIVHSLTAITFALPRGVVIPGNDSSDLFRFSVICATVFRGVFDLLMGFDLCNCEFAYRRNRLYATADALRYLRDHVIRVYDATEGSWSGLIRTLRVARLDKYAKRDYNIIERCSGFRPGRSRLPNPIYAAYIRDSALPSFTYKWDGKETQTGVARTVEEALRKYSTLVGFALEGLYE